jgi:hypothetical protein
MLLRFGDHPYIVTGITWAASVATIRCSPTLRRDYAAASLVEARPAIGRLVDDDNGALTLQSLRYGTPSIEFQEAFDGPFSRDDRRIAGRIDSAVRSTGSVRFHHDAHAVVDGILRSNDGRDWQGIGHLAVWPASNRRLMVMRLEATFSLSGVSSEILRLARDEFSRRKSTDDRLCSDPVFRRR